MNEFINRILYSIDITSISLRNAIILLGTTILLTLAVCLVYIFTHRKTGYSSSLILTILLIGPVAAIIVICIGSNLARAISIGGGLALIRYRNTVEDPKTLIFLFLSLACGMACGTGFIEFAFISVGLILLVIIITNLVGFDRIGGRIMKLSIIVPESLNFYEVFDPALKKYCKFHNLDRVRTTDYGTLIELNYRIRLKKPSEQKELIDEIRTMNGNLNVTIVQKASEH